MDIAEYALYATRQMGEISKGLEKAAGGQPYQKKSTCPQDGQVENQQPKPKKEVLADAGIDRRRAAEAEKLAAIPEEKFKAIVAKFTTVHK